MQFAPDKLLLVLYFSCLVLKVSYVQRHQWKLKGLHVSSRFSHAYEGGFLNLNEDEMYANYLLSLILPCFLCQISQLKLVFLGTVVGKTHWWDWTHPRFIQVFCVTGVGFLNSPFYSFVMQPIHLFLPPYYTFLRIDFIPRNKYWWWLLRSYLFF